MQAEADLHTRFTTSACSSCCSPIRQGRRAPTLAPLIASALVIQIPAKIDRRRIAQDHVNGCRIADDFVVGSGIGDVRTHAEQLGEAVEHRRIVRGDAPRGENPRAPAEQGCVVKPAGEFGLGRIRYEYR
jgi:hypothetical protein